MSLLLINNNNIENKQYTINQRHNGIRNIHLIDIMMLICYTLGRPVVNYYYYETRKMILRNSIKN